MRKFIKFIATPYLTCFYFIIILPIFFLNFSEASAEVNNLSNLPDDGNTHHEVLLNQGDSIKVEDDATTSEMLFSSEKSETDRGAGSGGIAIFPFDNFTVNDNALNAVMPVILEKIKNLGYSVVKEQEIYSFICNDRVRETGIISKDLSKKISNKFNVEGILLGSIVSYSIEEKPQLGVIARLINPSDGSIVWAEYFSATGDDYTTVLGLGEVKEMDELIQKVVNSLFESFTTEAPEKDVESTYRIAVLPFMNDSEYKDAGKIASQMFVVHLLKNSSFIPIEYGEVRKQLVDLRIRVKGNLDYNSIAELARVINVDGFLLGEVRLYFDGVMLDATPAASISARLIASRNKRLIWYDRYQMSGDDDVIIYDWRRLRSVDKVANKIVTKLVNNLEKIKWN